jgi:hypothetical protein
MSLPHGTKSACNCLWSEFFLTPLLKRAFFCSWLLLNLTGAIWRQLEMQKRQRIDRKWDQLCGALKWRHTTLIASFLYYSLHFTLLLFSLYSLSLYFFTVL